MNIEQFDTIIVGSGTSAHYVFDALAKNQKVAIIGENPLGGVCALKGCQPKKYLVAHQEARNSIHALMGKGFTSMPQSSWEDLQALKNDFTSAISGNTSKKFSSKATLFEGTARFCAPNQLQIGEKILEAKNIVLATGSQPRRSDIKGSEHLLISDDFLEATHLPGRIVFLGAGVIAFEFAHVAASFGCEVTIVHRSSQALKGFDADMTERFLNASAKAGIKILTDIKVTEIIKNDQEFRLIGDDGVDIVADAIYETIGRVPNLSVLEGDKSGVKASQKGIVVNEYMQSVSNEAVWAVGDCTQTPYQLATVADEQGKIAGANILKGKHLKWDDSLVATTIFTHPQLSSVGLTEQQAKESGIDFVLKEGETQRWPSSRRIGESDGAYKMVISKDNKLLGATILRHNSSEVINVCMMLIKTKMSLDIFKTMPLSYPTSCSDLKNML